MKVKGFYRRAKLYLKCCYWSAQAPQCKPLMKSAYSMKNNSKLLWINLHFRKIFVWQRTWIALGMAYVHILRSFQTPAQTIEHNENQFRINIVRKFTRQESCPFFLPKNLHLFSNEKLPNQHSFESICCLYL